MPRTNKILIRSGTVTPTASDFAVGEPAFDKSAGKLYIKNAAGVMVELGTGGGGGGSVDVYAYATPAIFPATGASAVIYIATDTSRAYQWAGTAYMELGPIGGNVDTVLRSLLVPPAPTSLTATPGNAQAVVSWTAPTVLAQTPITDYIVQFSTDSGSTWTTAAESITITTQPSNQTAASGAATFSVTATVSPSGTLTYQWQRSDDAGTTFANVSGATSATLSLTSLTNGSDNNDQYRVVVSALGAAPVTSSAATLTVAASAGLVVTTAGSGTGSWSGQGTLASKLIRSAVGATSWTIDPQFTVGFSGSLYITIGSRAGDFDFGPSVYLKVNGSTVKTIGYSGNPQFTPTAVSAGNTIQLSTELPDNSLVTVAMWIQ
jgi:hypothetical protein